MIPESDLEKESPPSADLHIPAPRSAETPPKPIRETRMSSPLTSTSVTPSYQPGSTSSGSRSRSPTYCHGAIECMFLRNRPAEPAQAYSTESASTSRVTLRESKPMSCHAGRCCSLITETDFSHPL